MMIILCRFKFREAVEERAGEPFPADNRSPFIEWQCAHFVGTCRGALTTPQRRNQENGFKLRLNSVKLSDGLVTPIGACGLACGSLP
jgi:hypothetical protein